MPTVAKLQTGAYTDVEPVAVVPVANSESVRCALLDAIARQNVIVPNPPKDDWPPPVLLKCAGVKTWSAFARGAAQWGIKEKDGKYQIVGHRTNRDGYWVEDSDQKTDFPPGTTVDDVVERISRSCRTPRENSQAFLQWTVASPSSKVAKLCAAPPGGVATTSA